MGRIHRFINTDFSKTKHILGFQGNGNAILAEFHGSRLHFFERLLHNNSKNNNNKNNNNPTVTSHVVLQHEVRLGVGEQIQDWFGKLNAMRKQSRELAECSHENWPSAATRIYRVEEH